MEILEVTKQCVSVAAGLFLGKEDDKTIKAHKSLFALHQFYEEAFLMIENRVQIAKSPFQMNKSSYKFINPNATVLNGGNSYICNCNKFDAKEFIYCPHILAVMFAEELQLCLTQATGSGNDYIRDILSFPNV